METIIKIHENQSLIDFALQYTGTLENCFVLALENGISVTDTLQAGKTLRIPNTKNNHEILGYFRDKSLQPATEVSSSQNSVMVYNKGIDYWAIGDNFTVQ